MPVQYLCAAFGTYVTSHQRNLVESAINDMANELEASTNFSVYTYFINNDISPGTKTEKEFVKASLEWLESKGDLFDGDAWIFVHREESYGFGGGEVKTEDVSSISKHAHGQAVLGNANELVTDRFLKGMAKHEMAHNLGAGHDEGCYSVDSAGKIYDITPMAHSYTYNADGKCDTQELTSLACGSGHVPTSFKCGKDNYKYQFIDNASYRWFDGLSGETLSIIKNKNEDKESSLLG